MKQMLFWVMGLLLVMGGSALADEADGIMGEWYTKDNKALVKVFKTDTLQSMKPHYHPKQIS